MKIWALSDLHLSYDGNKAMDVFGDNWEGYMQKIQENWQAVVEKDDVVLVSGDISWAMRLDEALEDLEFLSKLSSIKRS